MGQESLQIPRFGMLMSHVLPGILIAVSMLIYLDQISPEVNIMAYSFANIQHLAGIAGIVIVFGTMFGLIIDGIHHAVIEEFIFNRSARIKKNDRERKTICREYVGNENTQFYYFWPYIDTEKLNMFFEWTGLGDGY